MNGSDLRFWCRCHNIRPRRYVLALTERGGTLSIGNDSEEQIDRCREEWNATRVKGRIKKNSHQYLPAYMLHPPPSHLFVRTFVISVRREMEFGSVC